MAQCYDDVRTAGFVVDSHSCYRSISNCTMRFGPTLMTSARLIQEWPGIISSPAYATATAAIQAVSRLGYNTLIVRITRWPLTPLPVEPEDPSKQHLAINLNFQQSREVGHGRQMHTIGSFSNIRCSCKSKSHIVTNFPMRPYALSGIEKAGYGLHAVTASALLWALRYLEELPLMSKVHGPSAPLLLHCARANQLLSRNSNNGSDPLVHPRSPSLPGVPASIPTFSVLCLILPRTLT